MAEGNEAGMKARSDRRRWWALVIVCMAMFMNALDSSIVNVALPAIQRDLHFSPANLTWVVDAYLITFGACLLLAGRLGDLIGRRLVFLLGICLFTLSSMACGLAPDQAVLIIGRFFQGMGGALSSSVIIAIIFTEFPDAGERAKAMSAYIFVAVGGGSIGLLVGGVLTQAFNWHWIFFINLPIGIAVFLFGRALIVENPGLGLGDGVDIVGSILITVSLMVGIYAISGATTYGWLSGRTVGLIGTSVVLMVAFVILESRLANPIMPLRIFRIPPLVHSSVIRGLMATGMYTTFFLGALYVEGVLGFSPTRTGLAFMPVSLTVGLLSSGITARLVTRFGNKRVLVPGMCSATIGLLLLTQLTTQDCYLTVVLPGFLLVGIGAGTSFVPLLGIAMDPVPKEDAGLGSGIVNVSMQMAAALGLAIMSSVATGHAHALEAQGHSVAEAATSGYRLSFLIAGILVGIGTMLAAVLLREPASHDATTVRAVEIENATEPLAT